MRFEPSLDWKGWLMDGDSGDEGNKDAVKLNAFSGPFLPFSSP